MPQDKPSSSPLLRRETAADHAAIAIVNRLAFAGENEARLVDELRAGGYVRLSMVAELDGQVVGHVLFSRLAIVMLDQVVEALSLAPMAVLPAQQRQGIGSRLIEQSLRACTAMGHKIVVVLGHPEFYPRFGFSSKLAERLASPFAGRDSWMALELSPGALSSVEGRVEYPPPFGAFS